MTNTQIGKRFRTKVQDSEEDDEFGEVTHPVGSEFIVEAEAGGGHFRVAWQGTATARDGKQVPATGMWTLWTAEDLAVEATQIAVTG